MIRNWLDCKQRIAWALPRNEMRDEEVLDKIIEAVLCAASPEGLDVRTNESAVNAERD
jgi:hypothetical protein